MYTLGINAAFHDSAACLLKDGQLLAAAEDERFTHIKHGKRPIPFSAYELPFHAIHYCLEAAGIHLGEVDHVAYSFDPYILLDSPEAEKIAVPLNGRHVPLAEKWKSPWDPVTSSSFTTCSVSACRSCGALCSS